jgi:hypothetical protein
MATNNRTMKKILLLLCLVCGLQIGKCQTSGDNEIIVDSTNFRQVIETLLDDGYVIDKYDSTLGYISTQIKTIPKHNASVKIRVHIKNGNAYITGVYRVGIAQYSLVPGFFDRAGSYPVVYYRSALSTSRACWNEIKNLALHINSKIEFTKLQ